MKPHSSFDSLSRYARLLGFGEVHIKLDEETGLKSIIAIHNLKRGPAIGGCRFIPYASTDKALEDALRLGYMMSFKAAINNLPHGGAKAVIVRPKTIKDKKALFEKFGQFVNEQNGRYITAVDSGTSPKEMDIISTKTKFVTCTSESGSGNDPSPLTALGVRRSIQAAVKFKFGTDSLENIHVAVQGAGNVGYYLSKELHALGARLTVADINPATIERCRDEFGASIVNPEGIYHIHADVFAPCALGAILNLTTINQLNVSIVAGSANNQLAHHLYGILLHERGVLYAPDFLINAGGLIHVAVHYAHGTMQESLKQIEHIYDTAYEIFERSARENIATNKVAEKMALERLK